MKTQLIGVLYISLAISLSACELKKSDSGTQTTPERSLSPNEESAIDTSKTYIAKSVVITDKGTADILRDPSGAPLLPANTLSIDDNNWANNLDDLVGRVIKLKKNAEGEVVSFEIKQNIVADNIKVKIEVPSAPAKDEKLIDRTGGGQLKFLGIDLSMNNNQKFEYSNLMTLFTRVKDNEVDKTKIPSQYRGEENGYYYINSASVRVIETTKYTEKGRRIAVTDLSALGIAKPIDGKIYTSDINKDYQKFNRVFLTTLSLP